MLNRCKDTQYLLMFNKKIHFFLKIFINMFEIFVILCLENMSLAKT